MSNNLVLKRVANSLKIGDIVVNGTAESVLFLDSSNQLAQDNVNFNFNDSTDTLQVTNIDLTTGIISGVPSVDFDVVNKKYLDDNYATIVDDLYLLNSGDTGTGDYIFDGAVTINEAGADKDFRVEGLTEENLLFVDASTNRIGIGLNNPTEKLDVVGNIKLSGDLYFSSNPTEIFNSSSNRILYENATTRTIGFGALTGTLGSDNVFIGDDAGRVIQAGGIQNVIIGSQSGERITTGDKNVSLGYQTLRAMTTASLNVAIGGQALLSLISGNANNALGHQTLLSVTTGVLNTGFGHESGWSITNGTNNVFLGAYAGLFSSTSASNNVLLGVRAGESVQDANVMIGFNAGRFEAGSNKLYIENSNSTTPLIYGEFDNDFVRIYGDFRLGDNKKFDLGDAQDAEIYYDGTDLIIDPAVVGTGGVSIPGDTFWTGAGSGIPFANVYGNEIAWTQASAVQNTWYPIVDADMTSGELNLITHDNNGKITFAKAGRYKINLDFALESNSANVHIQVASRVNTTIQNAYNHTQIKFANTQEAVSLSTIVSVSANDTLEAVIRTTDVGTPNITVDHLVITATMVGG